MKTMPFSRLNSILFLFLMLSVISCTAKESSDTKSGPEYNAAEAQRALQEQLAKIDESFLNELPTIEYLDTLRNYYAAHQYQFQLVKTPGDTLKVGSLLSLIAKAPEHGLDPNLYHYDAIINELQKYKADNDNAAARYTRQANLEILLSNAVLRYAWHLRYGVVNPAKLFPESYFLPLPDSTKTDLFKPLSQPDVLSYLKEIQPKSPRYLALQTALKHYASISNLYWPKIKVTEKKIKIGEKSSLLKPIAERLVELGFIDTTKTPVQNFKAYTKEFDKFVASFQRAQGLIDDGSIGKATIEKLNITPAEYCDQIKINLERFRWGDYSNTQRYIMVNVPDFYLHIMENGQEKVKIRVCAGRKKPANYDERLEKYRKTKFWRDKPDNWETPQVASEVYRLILNPTWSVPPTIIREEIYPGVMKDPNYLKKKNFKVFLHNKEISLDEVDLRKFAPNKVPYSIVQGSGEGNALGKIKFLFKNKFDVYLHDTPTRAPFASSNRAVSHGCMRVEKPMLLAEYVLKDHPVWNLDYVKTEIGLPADDKAKAAEYKEKRSSLRRGMGKEKYTSINLEKKIPIFVDYYTSWVDESGIVNLRNDVYGRDKMIKAALAVSK